MIYTTLDNIRSLGPCRCGWRDLLNGLGKRKADDEPLAFSRIVEIVGLEDAVWCAEAEPSALPIWEKVSEELLRGGVPRRWSAADYRDPWYALDDVKSFYARRGKAVPEQYLTKRFLAVIA